ncbi:MAG: lamin tail domain-containing protein, partial [Anaerolineae bacterium]
PTLTDTPTDTPIPIETSTPTLTPTPAPTLPPGTLLISEVLYDGTIPGEEGDEMVELCNYGTATIPLDGCKIGDEEVPGGNEGMYIFPAGAAIGPGSCLVIAKSGVQFQSRFGFYPDFEFRGDTPQVPDMIPYPAWSSGRWALANGGDEVLLLGPDDRIVDAVAYGGGNFAALGLVGMAEATQPFSLQRIGAQDTDDMSADFLSVNPNPGQATYLPPPPDPPPPGLALPGGLRAYLGSFKSHTNLSDNCAPAGYIFALGRSAGLHFLGLSDPADSLDGPGWNYLARAAHEATEEGAFIALRGFEWHQEETGSFNVFATEDFLSPESPGGSTLEGFYSWLAARPEAIAQFNFSDNSFAYQAAVEEAMCLLETDFSGAGDFLACDARYLRSLQFGWHVAPAGNAAIYHPDCPPSQEGEAAWRTGVLAWALTETELLAALRAGRAFATQDENLALALRTRGAWMGATVPPASTLTLYVDFADPDGEPLTLVLFDQALVVASTSLPAGAASGTWPVIVEGRAGHFFFAKAFQADGQVAYTAPIWVEGQTEPESLALNEILPAPHEVDWDGDGKADSADEWIELYNPTSKDIGLGDWQMDDVPDGGSKPFTFPPGAFIPARGFLVLYNRQTGLTLNNDGDTVRLLRPDGTVADEFTYSRSKYDRPWSRKDDGYGEWVDNYIPTPGQPNRPGAPTPTPTPETLPQRQWRSIAEARKLVPLTPLIVTGWVTVPPDLLESKRMYVQDLTGGIQVYLKGGGFPSMAEGDWVEIIGWMADYHGEREIRIATPADAMLLSGNRRPLAPQPIRTGQVGEEYEGLLVQIKGRATGCEEDKLYLDDGSGPAEVYFKSYAIRRPRAEEGQIFTVTGVVSQYAPKKPYMGGYRLLPRYESDIQPGE